MLCNSLNFVPPRAISGPAQLSSVIPSSTPFVSFPLRFCSPSALVSRGRSLSSPFTVTMAADSVSTAPPSVDTEDTVLLLDFLSQRSGNLDGGLANVILHLQAACKRIAALLASPAALQVTSSMQNSMKPTSASRDAPKPLDIVANDIIKAALRKSGNVAALASEEEDSPVWIGEGQYVVVFDPLDGSRNIDASIPTGTIFGIYRRLFATGNLPLVEQARKHCLRKGSELVASGYALYSSATMLCLSVGDGAHAFTLDGSCGEFVLTHRDLKIPKRGQIYSVNDARYHDWPAGLRRYIDDIRQGKGQYPKKYSARYICSLVADLHRTILYGGVAMNPRSHLRLVYEAHPLSFLVEQAHGKGSDGKRRILDLQATDLHQRLPLFLGSPDDILELESYGDVQQLVNPGYEV
ncbi:hypothetical protein R1sor_014170 [Riccia sorocarpa]|uniref:fructose-bisphosphatase n=1 Tax=Riccia sorocarpa TaxID=122646 RepID=A0ABD3HAH8_9MARC